MPETRLQHLNFSEIESQVLGERGPTLLPVLGSEHVIVAVLLSLLIKLSYRLLTPSLQHRTGPLHATNLHLLSDKSAIRAIFRLSRWSPNISISTTKQFIPSSLSFPISTRLSASRNQQALSFSCSLPPLSNSFPPLKEMTRSNKPSCKCFLTANLCHNASPTKVSSTPQRGPPKTTFSSLGHASSFPSTANTS